MKRFIFVIAFASLSLLVIAQEPIYQVKSGKIVYRYETAGVASDYTLFFTDNGKKVAMEFNIMMDGVMEKSRTISTPEAMYLINYSQRQATKLPVEMAGEQNMAEDEGQLDVSNISVEIKNKGAQKTGTGVVAGKTCDIYEYTDANGQKAKYWIWNGLLMKGDFIEEGYHSFIEIKEIATDIAIDEKEFQIPAGFEVTDMSDAMKQMQQMQQMYGNPEDE